uniref:alpha/beta fold hydrolase n=1 Tax=uncultured Nostoc sp. TaxID=340711 RepID=UPI0035CAAC9B
IKCAGIHHRAIAEVFGLLTLVLAGRHDWICAPEFSEEIAQAIPNADLRIFENSSHLIRADEPEALLDAIAGFLVYKH